MAEATSHMSGLEPEVGDNVASDRYGLRTKGVLFLEYEPQSASENVTNGITCVAI